MTKRYFLVAAEVVEDVAVDDGGLAHEGVAQKHDLAFCAGCGSG